MKRVILNVASGQHHQRGQMRLVKQLSAIGSKDPIMTWGDLPTDWRKHSEFPYAFKCHALRTAAAMGYEQFLWLDACIFPLRSLEPIWQYAAEHGAWISRNGFSNYEWTADSAYPELFRGLSCEIGGLSIDEMRSVNRSIEHVVAGAFALDIRRLVGRAIFNQYCRLGLETDAFCGPWMNQSHSQAGIASHPQWTGSRIAPCGPPDVRGHRHDQTALSVCAWRAGVQLTSPPAYLAYGKAADVHNNATILLADGGF